MIGCGYAPGAHIDDSNHPKLTTFMNGGVAADVLFSSWLRRRTAQPNSPSLGAQKMRPVSEAVSIPSISSILDEMRLLPEEYAELAGKLATARTESRRTLNAMSSAYHHAWLNLKANHGMAKTPTVDDLKALTELDAAYLAARDVHLAAQDRVAKLEAALAAFDHKSRMLQSIGALVRHQAPKPVNTEHPLSDVDSYNE